MKILNLFRFTLFVLSVLFSVNVAFAQSSSEPEQGPEPEPIVDPCNVTTPRIKAATSACDASVVFTVQNYNSSLSYTWTINGATYTGAGASYTVSNPVDGATYTATVVAEESGCTSAVSNSVSQSYVKSPAEPKVSVTHDCGFPIVFKLDNKSDYPANYNQVWKVNGTTVTPVNGEYSFSNYSDGVTYTLNLEISNAVNGVTCKKTATASVVAKVPPTSPRTNSYKECAVVGKGTWASLVTKSNTSNTINWYSSETATNAEVAPIEFDKEEVGKQTYWVTQVSNAGCESLSRAEVSVVVYAVPVADAGPDLIVCEGTNAVLAENISEDINMKYSWKPEAKLQTTNAQTVTTKPLSENAEFTLKVSNKENSNCFSEDKVNVTVLKKPQITFDQSKYSTCEEGSIVIINKKANSSLESYEWYDVTNSTYLGSTKELELESITESVEIQLTASLDELSSCSTSKKVNVEAVKRPIANAGDDRDVCYGESVQLGTTAVSGVKYSWNNASDLNNPNIANPTVRVTDSKTYELTATLTSDASCFSTDEVNINKIDRPTKYTLTGGGSYCEGSTLSGIHLTLSNSDSDTEYELVKNGVGDGVFRLGDNGRPMEWRDVEEGTYRVRARKAGYNTCEEDMIGSVVVKKEQSPEATIELVNSNVACPGDEVTVRVSITGGVAPYKFTLRTKTNNNVREEEKQISGNTYEFPFTPTETTVFQVTKVSDAVCSKEYDPMVYIPTLDMAMSSFASFQIYADKPNPVCHGADVTLKIDYNDPAAQYIWESGLGTNSIQVSASSDAVYNLTVVTPEGCRVPSKPYELKVVEKVPIKITGFPKLTADQEFFLCSSDDPVTPTVVPSAGKFTSTPAGLIENMTRFNPKNVAATTNFEVKYEYTDTYGCKRDTTFNFIVSAVNKTVNWTMGPTNAEPGDWAPSFQKCQPDPNNPKDVVNLQGNPQVKSGTWSIEKTQNSQGVTIPNQAQIVETDEELALAQLKNITAGETYFITYKVVDMFGCEGSSTKEFKVNSKPTTYVSSGGLSVSPSSTLCINQTSATISAAQNPGTLTLSKGDAAMFVENPDNKSLVIDPSKGKVGNHKVIYTYEDVNGCKFSEEVYFDIVNPVSINKFILPKKEFCQTESPVEIEIDANVPTTGSIEILNQDGETKLGVTDITNKPMFNPNWGPGTYTIIYRYNDGICDAEYSEKDIVVHPTPTIEFLMKDDYCYGEEIAIKANYNGGEITIDPLLPVETLVGNIFKTEHSGLGVFTIGYKVNSEFGCEGEASKQFQVRGVENMSIMMDTYFCEPAGTHKVEGFPKTLNADDNVFFTTDQNIDLIDNGDADGIGEIGLDRTTYNTVYSITYHYVESYLDKDNNPQTCESTETKDFKVLDQTSDFYGVNDGETICSDVIRRDIIANLKNNTTFVFSASDRYPNAFTDNGDGTAVLLPSELPEDYYYIDMTHEYFDTDGKPVCLTQKRKVFRISKIEEVTDITLFCDPVENKTAVKLKNAEKDIQYDLYVNNTRYDTYVTTGDNAEVNFKAIDLPSSAFATVYVMAVEPHAEACTRKMSKEYSFTPLIASVTSKNITCNGAGDGQFTGSAQGGFPAYQHKLLDANDVEIAPVESSITLEAGTYKYVVTDDIGCVETVTFDITEPNVLDAIIETNEVDCYGGVNAILKATVLSNAGTAPYTYEWTKLDPLAGNQVIPVGPEQSTIEVGAGEYHVKITDANNCEFETFPTVTAPLRELTVKLDYKVDVQIRGNATGEIYVSVDGGTPDAAGLYKYTWSGVGITDANRNLEDLQGLVSGTYSLLVEDEKGCKAYISVFIAQPTEIKVIPTIHNVKCFGESNGVVSLSISGGKTPYTITWTDENNNIIASDVDLNELNSLPAGKYYYEVVDALGNVYPKDMAEVMEESQLIVKTSLRSVLDNKCHGDEEGNIILEIHGGTGVYTVDWGIDPSKIVSDTEAINLGKGKYTIDVTDSNNCSYLHEVEVTEPDEKLDLLSAIVTQNKCHDGLEGAIVLEMKGGTPNYTYTWHGAGVNPTNKDQSNLKAGEEYSVTVHDANRCSWVSTFTMENPQELTLSLSKKDITCNGYKNGSIEATVTGEQPFTYTWTAPATVTTTYPSVPRIDCEEKGAYTLTVTDSKGCTITDGVQINEPSEVTGRVEYKNISCHDANDGSIIVYAQGGSGIYTYALYKVGETTPIATDYEWTDLIEGSYQYKVLDSNGCPWTTDVVNIINPNPVDIKYNVSNVTIHGEADGKIDLNITGGTKGLSGYKISWIDGSSIVSDPADPAYNANKNTITGLLSDTYSVVVEDENKCAATADIFVDQPEIITLDYKVTDVQCNGYTNGMIELSNIAGGTGPGTYTITLTNSQGNVSTITDLVIDALSADTYELKVVDAAGAEFIRKIEVKQPDEIKIKTVPGLSKLSVDCFGNATGKIKVNISGGSGVYDYYWVGTTGVNVDYVENLATGTYGIILRDDNGCTHDTYKETIIGPADELRITESIIENKCYGENNAQININVTGGTQPYKYLWTGAGLDESVVENEDQTNLYNGQAYKVTVIDALNCVKDVVYTLGKREEILLSTSHEDVLCHGQRKGTLKATVSGGTGKIQYKWENADASYSSTELEISDLYAGTYTFTVEDEAGCVKTSEEIIYQPDELKASLPSDFALCGGVDDGELYVTVTGGTPIYKYEWHKDYDATNPIGFGAHLTNLGAGNYEVFIEDANGCTANDEVKIESSVPMQIILIHKEDVNVHGGNDGSIEIDATGGTEPLTYTWSGPTIDPNAPATGKTLSNLVAGYYNVTIEDAVGCKITERIEISQPETLTVVADITDIKCFGEKGKILLRVSGGTPDYTFNWSSTNGYTNSTQTPEVIDLEAGVYDVTIVDARGAETKRQYVISNKEQLTWTLLTSKTELDCYDKNDANINIHVIGGTLPYTVNWTGPNYTNSGVFSIGNLGVGVYSAEIKDANNCVVDRPFIQEITQPEELKLDAVLTPNNCSNDKDGAIDITVTGGTPNYTFRWSGFDVDPTAEDQANLPKGEYTLHLEDANRCIIDKVFSIHANNEISAIISGPSNICSGEEFQIQIDVNGLAPWTIEYTDGVQIYTETTDQRINVYTHSLLADAEFKLIKVVDANGCEAKLSESVIVDVHEVPQITIVSAQEDCCLGEPALIDIIFAGKGPWTINYTDGTLDYIDGPFTADRDFLKIIPKQIGTKTYTITSVSNENCTVPVDYSVDITAYTYPNLEVDIAPSLCEPDPAKVYLHATGEAPWHVVYYLNNLKYEHEMTQPDEELNVALNTEENLFIFESIKSGKRCLSELGKEISVKMNLLPKDATTIIGANMVCRNSTTTFSTPDIPYAESYKWSLPAGFNIVSGLGSNNIEVQVNDEAKGGKVSVWGVNKCGDGIKTSIDVEVDKPMSIIGAEITIPPYICDDETIFPLSVSEVDGATHYEWVMPTGYHVLSGQGTRSVMVQIDKYALSNTVSVIPGNICTQTEPIKANIVIRSLPLAEAGVDFVTDCSDVAKLGAFASTAAVSSQWSLISGNAIFEDKETHNTNVSGLMYGDNILSWNVNDGYCVGYDYVKVTNQNPGITQPEFSEVTICEDYMMLRAGKPEFGMGRWTLVAGDGEIENPNSNETLITGLSNKRTNIIRWEVYSPQCSNEVNVAVVSHDLKPLVDAGEDGISTTGSFRLSARVVNDSQLTGTWTVEAGSGTIEDPHNPNTVVNGLATGVNTIRWTISGYECEAYDEIRVRMVDEPIASFNIENTEGCEPLTVLFTNTTIGNAEYKWEFGDGSTSDLRSPVHIFEKAGKYTVKLTATGDKRTDTFTGVVNVLPSPVAAFSAAERQLYVPNAEAHFYSETEDAVQHYWEFGDGGTSNKANPVYTYVEDGLYDVKYVVSDINLCSDTLVMKDYIKVGKNSYLVFPTAFTPNVEHSNGGVYSQGERRLDVFYPIGRNVDIYKLEIFSSWGNKVFESNDQYIGWDGYYLGKCAAQGTYFYKAEGRFKDGTAFQYSGNLMLIR